MRIVFADVQLILLLTIVAATPLHAQAPGDTTTKVGDHVRVHVLGADSTAISGRLRFADMDSLMIDPDDSDGSMTINRDEITRLEVERNAKTRERASSVMGIVGALAGGGAAIAVCMNNPDMCAAEQFAVEHERCHDESYVTTGSLLLAGGALAGALLGYALAPAPHWDVVAVPTGMPGPGGQRRLGLNIGFRYSEGRKR